MVLTRLRYMGAMALLLVGTADAARWCAPGELHAGADLIYWKPAACASVVGLREDEPRIVQHSVDILPDYGLGFRVWGLFERGCFISHLSYLRTESSDRPRMKNKPDTILLGAGLGTNEPLVILFPRLHYQYQRVDLHVGQLLHKSKGASFAALAKMQFIDICRTQEADAETISAGRPSYRERSTFRGGALGVGLNGSFCIKGQLSAFGELAGLALIGERALKKLSVELINGTQQEVSRPEVATVLPAVNYRFGLQFRPCCRGVQLFVELGYEGHYYWNALDYANPTVGANFNLTPLTQSADLTCHDAGFGGPYFRLGVTY